MSKELNFQPYVNYISTVRYIDDFVQISALSFGITKHLMNKHSKDSLPKIEIPKIKKNELSFSVADLKVKSVRFVCGWLSIDAYANKLNLPKEDVEKLSMKGGLGPITTHPKTGEHLIIYPQEYQNHDIATLPEPGKNKFEPKISITAKASVEIDEEDLDEFETTQKQLLRMAYLVGDTEELETKAEKMLYQSSLLLQWTAFEVYIRETIHELYRCHPEKLSKGQKGTAICLSYSDVLSMSENFSSIQALRESIVNCEIEKHKKDGQSISALINFLKAEFKFKNDPYSAWYVMEGDRRTASFQKITEIKDVRNALVHDAGKNVDLLLKMYPHLTAKEGDLIVSSKYYSECFLVLRSIAFSIAKNIGSKEYICS